MRTTVAGPGNAHAPRSVFTMEGLPQATLACKCAAAEGASQASPARSPGPPALLRASSLFNGRTGFPNSLPPRCKLLKFAPHAGGEPVGNDPRRRPAHTPVPVIQHALVSKGGAAMAQLRRAPAGQSSDQRRVGAGVAICQGRADRRARAEPRSMRAGRGIEARHLAS